MNKIGYFIKVCMQKYYSKEFQDILVSTLIPTPGFFLDIGMGDPISGNNTYLLEQNGWSGFLFDQNKDDINRANSIRRNEAIQCDASNFDWLNFLKSKNTPKIIDYISMDVDAANISVINNFPFDHYEVKIITFEHDRYNNGDVRKDAYNNRMKKFPDYIFLLENAKITGLEWEDWIINKKHFDLARLEKFIKIGAEAEEYVKNLVEKY